MTYPRCRMSSLLSSKLRQPKKIRSQGYTYLMCYLCNSKSGDLSKRPQDCGLFQQLAFTNASVLEDGSTLELALNEPISLQVGDDGIIGRRVSIFPRAEMDNAVAEGIVGFNFVNSL